MSETMSIMNCTIFLDFYSSLSSSHLIFQNNAILNLRDVSELAVVSDRKQQLCFRSETTANSGTSLRAHFNLMPP